MIQKEREREKEGCVRVRIDWNVRLFSELYDKGRDAEFETFRSVRKDGTTKKIIEDFWVLISGIFVLHAFVL